MRHERALNTLHLLHRLATRAFDEWAKTYHAEVTGMIERRGYSYRALAQEIVRNLEPRSGDVLLEVGTGPGTLGHRVAAETGSPLVGIDLSHQMLDRAAHTGAYSALSRACVERLPFEDGGFHGLFCSFVLHSVSNQRRAMAEMWRVLQPGAGAVLIDLCPIGRPDWLATIMGVGHSIHREYGAIARYRPVERYVRLALGAGFFVTLIKPLGARKLYSHYVVCLRKE